MVTIPLESATSLGDDQAEIEAAASRASIPEFLRLSAHMFPGSKKVMTDVGMPVGFELDMAGAAQPHAPTALRLSPEQAAALRCPSCQACICSMILPVQMCVSACVLRCVRCACAY